MTTTPIIIASHVRIEAAANGQRRFKVDAYSGGALRVNGYSLPVVPDLAGMSADSRIVANLDHDPSKRVGHVDSVDNDGSQLKLAGIVSAVSTAAAEFVDSATGGFPWSASIEAQPDSMEEVPRGETTQANGRTFTGPVLIARRSTLYGIAFLSKGADSSARVMLATTKRIKRMSAFKDWARSMVTDFDSLDHDELSVLHANFNGRTEPTSDDREAVQHFPTIHASTGDPVVDAERQRIRKIEKITSGDFGEMTGHVRELRAQAIAGDISYTDLRDGVCDALHQRIPSSADVQQVRGVRSNDRVIEAALCLMGNISSPEKHFDERTLDAADRATRGLGLQSILMQTACQHGYRARPGEYVTDGNIRPVLAAAFSPVHASGFSGLDISNVLSSTANKMLVDGFSEMPSEWRAIAAIKPVRNFHAHTFVRLLDSLEYDEVAGDGQIKHGTLGDSTMTAQASTYARMLTITRKDIINDDLSALTDVPRRLGRAAGQKFNNIFWTAFNASDSFWDSSNSNVLEGAGTELDAAGVGLTAAIAAFRAQRSTTADGSKLVGGKPAILLVPPALEIVARRLLNSAGIVTGEDATLPSGNPFQGLCMLVVEDRLSAAEGGSDAEWYLLRSPSFAPCMLVPALDGRVEPTVETTEADFSVLGIAMRGYSDVGASRGEPLSGLQMAGTPAE